MSGASSAGQARREEFVRETRILMLRRARVGILLGSGLTLVLILVDATRIAPDRFSEAVAVRITGAVLLVGLLAAARSSNAVRWSEWIAGGVFAILTATIAAIMRLYEGAADPEYVTQATGIALCMLGAGIFLPFDAPKMLALGAIALGMHIGFTFDFSPAQNFPVLVSTLAAVVVATVGARELMQTRRAEFEERRAKEDARSDFVAMLTHDIKNPLAAIDGFVEILRDDAEMPSGMREELLAHVQTAVRTAIALAVNFLDASKIEADRFILRTHRIDLDELVRSVLSEQRPTAEHKGVHLLHESAAELPHVDADAAALGRVLANLIGNAIKHTPAGGTVRVAARLSASTEAEIIVEDTGEGIRPGQESRIFERYTDAASRADSTGLGLFIARTLTNAHGGTIRAENRQDGAGARFIVALPAAVAQQ